jgi:hypothetical protein
MHLSFNNKKTFKKEVVLRHHGWLMLDVRWRTWKVMTFSRYFARHKAIETKVSIWTIYSPDTYKLMQDIDELPPTVQRMMCFLTFVNFCIFFCLQNFEHHPLFSPVILSLVSTQSILVWFLKAYRSLIIEEKSGAWWIGNPWMIQSHTAHQFPTSPEFIDSLSPASPHSVKTRAGLGHRLVRVKVYSDEAITEQAKTGKISHWYGRKDHLQFKYRHCCICS